MMSLYPKAALANPRVFWPRVLPSDLSILDIVKFASFFVMIVLQKKISPILAIVKAFLSLSARGRDRKTERRNFLSHNNCSSAHVAFYPLRYSGVSESG